MNNIFVCGGRTGGPLIPMIALANQLEIKNKNIVIVGIKNGFEKEYAKKTNLDIIYLPEAKLSILSFKPRLNLMFIKSIFKSIYSIFLLKISFLKSIYFLIRYKPVLILNAGGFTSVPVIIANKLLKLLKLSKTKVVVHQQDPLAGLSNKLTIRFADISSFVFDYSKDRYSFFKNSMQVLNPLDVNRFLNIADYKNKNFKTIFKSGNNKKNLLFMGGGGGAKSINDWVYNNKKSLDSYNVISLTGHKQDPKDQEKWLSQNGDNFYATKSTIDDITNLIMDADLVITRAGLSAITELKFLEKKSILVPLPNSHQELNAEVVKNDFEICNEVEFDGLFKKIEILLNKKNKALDINHSIDKYKKLNSNYHNKILNII